MSGAVSNEFRLMVPHGKLAGCIAFLEEGLRALQPTEFHAVLGKTFLHQREDLGRWIAEFAEKAEAAKVGLKAFYLEMNGFTINPGEWHCNLFGYKAAGDIWDLNWLSSWDAENRERFVLTGMEDVQQAYADVFGRMGERSLSVRLAAEVTEHLVTARFMELVGAAHKWGKSAFAGLNGFPILATAHDWDVVHQTT